MSKARKKSRRAVAARRIRKTGGCCRIKFIPHTPFVSTEHMVVALAWQNGTLADTAPLLGLTPEEVSDGLRVASALGYVCRNGCSVPGATAVRDSPCVHSALAATGETVDMRPGGEARSGSMALLGIPETEFADHLRELESHGFLLRLHGHVYAFTIPREAVEVMPGEFR